MNGMIAKIFWCRPGIAAEKTRKISRITESKIFRDLAYRHAGIKQTTPGFKQHALMQNVKGATAIKLMAQVVQMNAR